LQSGVPHINLGILKKFEIKIPALRIQRKIAAVLSAYDDLIENNNRRIALLEKMGEELYREWFVRLRFPGHESTKIVKGVPEGWNLKKLPEIASITYGFPFDGSRFNTNGIGMPIIRIRNIPKSQTGDFTDEHVHEKYIVRKGELLIGMDGEFHINHWYSADALLVQRSCRVQAKDSRHNGYLTLAIRGPIKYFESIIQGATVGHLGAKHLNGIDILEPPENFNLSVFNTLLNQRIKLESSNRAIQGMRDRLLTRLMSGKIDLEALDIAFPPSMKEAA
jgi:type I restriction enzyme S subunit